MKFAVAVEKLNLPRTEAKPKEKELWNRLALIFYFLEQNFENYVKTFGIELDHPYLHWFKNEIEKVYKSWKGLSTKELYQLFLDTIDGKIITPPSVRKKISFRAFEKFIKNFEGKGLVKIEKKRGAVRYYYWKIDLNSLLKYTFDCSLIHIAEPPASIEKIEEEVKRLPERVVKRIIKNGKLTEPLLDFKIRRASIWNPKYFGLTDWYKHIKHMIYGRITRDDEFWLLLLECLQWIKNQSGKCEWKVSEIPSEIYRKLMKLDLIEPIWEGKYFEKVRLAPIHNLLYVIETLGKKKTKSASK